MGISFNPSIKRPHIQGSWRIQDQPEFGLPIGDIIWHDCPYDGEEMFAVTLECALCKSNAPDFIQLAVKLGQAHTVSTMLTLQDHRLGWTILTENEIVINRY
jgi:hypothetical protein